MVDFDDTMGGGVDGVPWQGPCANGLHKRGMVSGAAVNLFGANPRNLDALRAQFTVGIKQHLHHVIGRNTVLIESQKKFVVFVLGALRGIGNRRAYAEIVLKLHDALARWVSIKLR